MSDLERSLLDAAGRGGEYVCSPSGASVVTSWEQVSDWGSRQIRGSVLAGILAGEYGALEPARKELVIIGVEVVGELDFSHMFSDLSLAFVACQTSDALVALQPRLNSLAIIGSQFRSIEFADATFAGSLRIVGSELDLLDISGSEIRGSVAVERSSARRSSSSIMLDRTAVKSLHFVDTECSGSIELIGVQISGVLVVENCILRQAKRSFVAEDCRIGGPMLFRLDSPPAGEVDVAYTQVAGPLIDDLKSWPQRIKVAGFTYRTLEGKNLQVRERVKWLARGEPFSAGSYSQLARAYREMGDEESARRILIARENARLRRGDSNFAHRLWRLFLGLTVAYGYKPWRALVPFAIIASALSIVFALPASRHDIVPSRAGGPQNAAVACVGYPCFSPTAYVVDTMLPIIDLHQEANWEPSPVTPLGRSLRYLMWFMIISGWLLTTAVVGGVSLTWRRE